MYDDKKYLGSDHHFHAAVVFFVRQALLLHCIDYNILIHNISLGDTTKWLKTHCKVHYTVCDK